MSRLLYVAVLQFLLPIAVYPSEQIEVVKSSEFSDRSRWAQESVKQILEGWKNDGSIALTGAGEMKPNVQTAWALLAVSMCTYMGDLRFNPKYAKSAQYLHTEVEKDRLTGEMAWVARLSIAVFGNMSHKIDDRPLRREMYVSAGKLLGQMAQGEKIDLGSCCYALMLLRVGLWDLQPKDRVFLSVQTADKLKALLNDRLSANEGDRISRIQSTLGLALLHGTATGNHLCPKLRESLKEYTFDAQSPDWNLWFFALTASSLLCETDIPGKGTLGIPGLLGVEYLSEDKPLGYHRTRQMLLYAIWANLLGSNLGNHPPIEGALADLEK